MLIKCSYVVFLPGSACIFEALAALIEARRAQSRFQLVLITHDEACHMCDLSCSSHAQCVQMCLDVPSAFFQAFVNRLAQLQVCDWFYRIHKDEAQQISDFEFHSDAVFVRL